MGTLEGFPFLPALWLRQAKPGCADAIVILGAIVLQTVVGVCFGTVIATTFGYGSGDSETATRALSEGLRVLLAAGADPNQSVGDNLPPLCWRRMAMCVHTGHEGRLHGDCC